MGYQLPTWVKFTQKWSPNYTVGREGNTAEEIAIHWWDAPERKPQFDPVVNILCTPARRASIHFVVENGRVCQLVDLANTAWHAGNWDANTRTVGIECNPRMSAGDLETVAHVIAFIRASYGRYMRLRGHQEYSSTACPGTYMSQLAWLDRRAQEILNQPKKTTPTNVEVPRTVKDKPMIIELAEYATGSWKKGSESLYALLANGRFIRFTGKGQADAFKASGIPVTRVTNSMWEAIAEAHRSGANNPAYAPVENQVLKELLAEVKALRG